MRRFLFFGLLFVVGCSSLRQQADAQFEQGAYDEALRLYDQALVADPSDSAASAGQRKTRLKLIDQRLLTVRHTRLGGNAAAALKLLQSVASDEIEWKAFPGGAVASTQEEETHALFPYFRTQVDAALKKNRPLRARYLVEHHRAVFSGQQPQAIEAMASKAAVLGRASCAQLGESANAGVPYFAQFLSKYCGLWGLDTAAYQRAANGKLADLYKNVEASVHLAGTDEGLEALFENSAEQSFRKSPWFDAAGQRSATMTLSGRFVRDYDQIAETRVHSYTVQVPYTAYETVTKTRYVERRSYAASSNVVSDGDDYVPTTPSYHSYSVPETYQDTVAVTRYRSEPRTQIYDGVVESQLLALSLGGRARFGATERKISFSKRSNTSGFRHDWSMPSIGLYPEPSKLANPERWISEQAEAFGENILNESDDAWDKLYCRPLGSGSGVAAQGNQVHRCLRRKPESVPAFVTAWYTTQFGVTPDEAETLFSLNDF